MENTVKVSRQVIKARDIQLFFGKQERQSFKMIAEMRAYFQKEKHQPITVTEFCTYYKVNPKELYVAMKETEEFKLEIADRRNNKPKAVESTNSCSSVQEITGTESYTSYKFSPRVL